MDTAIQNLINLNDLKQLIAAIDKDYSFEQSGKLWCPTCRNMNRFWINANHVTVNKEHFAEGGALYSQTSRVQWRKIAEDPSKLNGTQFRLHCATCHKQARALVIQIHTKQSIAIFFDVAGSIASINTPLNIRHYLEEAFKCNSVKAYSATLAMYRTALDAVLFNTGYTKGMVGNKIAELEQDITNGKAPKWTSELDTEFLKVLKNLGNSSLHISGTDISNEQNITDDLINDVEVVFNELLDIIYERDAIRKARLAKLSAASDKKSGK